MTSGHRDRLLLRFRNLETGERGLLSNARCLGEGVDVPSIDGVAFIDPRRSTIDIVQALGRAIRKAPDKKLGTIVLPVFLSDDEDPDEVLDESAFKHVWDVLKALRAHDEALGEELDELRRRLGARRSPPRRPGKIKLDVPADRVGAEFARAFNARLVEHTTATWEFWFGLLQRYVEREGHARVPQPHREDDYNLGPWVNTQRASFKRGHLDRARRARLEALPGWVWDKREANWEEGFAALQRFVQREGHARVASGTREDGHKLDQWVLGQRHAFQKGTLDPERRARLEALPGWIWDVKEADWEKGFAHLQRFVEREGHGRVPTGHREGDYKLGSWISKQRDADLSKRLDPQRRARLEALPGWVWDAPEAVWEEGFAALQRFVAREGHAQVPYGHHEDGYRLGNWVGTQRAFLKRGKLGGSRRARLEALPGWVWDPHKAAWEEGFAALQQFVEREGHARVPQGHREGDYKLGSWVGEQRAWFRRRALDEARRARLEALPGWAWDPHEADWQENFAALGRFVEREGHARVPRGHREGDYKLGSWVNRQRAFFSRGQFDEIRRERLEALPGWTWSTLDAGWEEGFAALERFAEREGHAQVPSSHREDHYRLGAWVGGQRSAYRKGTLDPERRARLEALPGWTWDVLEANWEEGFAHLRSFVEREGHPRVPSTWVEDGFPLGTWAKVQRRAFRRRLQKARRDRLEALPGWTWDRLDSDWEEGFARLQRFVEREGHARVPHRWLEADFRLGQWVGVQRSAQHGGRLSKQRARRLEALPGWVWNTKEALWEDGYAHLNRFVEREGHSRVPQAYRAKDGFKLGTWVNSQRSSRKRGELSEERVRRLEALPGWVWDARQAE